MPEDNNNQGGMPAGEGSSQGGGTPPNESNQELTFDGWFGEQPEHIQALVRQNESGLKTALESERTQRKELAKTLKDVTKELKDNTEAKTALEGLSGKLESYELQVTFYETATAAGVTNLKLAWIAARESGAIDGRGTVNMETLKNEYPELFKKAPAPPGNAGAGAGNGAPAGQSMDSYIRRAAGRQ